MGLVTWGMADLNRLPELTMDIPYSPIILGYSSIDAPDDAYKKYVSNHENDNEVNLKLLQTLSDYESEEEGDLIIPPSLCYVNKGDDLLYVIFNERWSDSIIILVYDGDADEIISEFYEYSSIRSCGKIEAGTTRHQVSEGIVIESITGYENERDPYEVNLPFNKSRIYLDDKLIGIAYSEYSGTFGYVPTLKFMEILEPYRRMGHGSTLFEFLMKKAEDQGFEVMGIDTVQNNGFFDKYGVRYITSLKEMAFIEL